MERFVIRKNTLPYIYQWVVIDIETGDKIGNYRTKRIAQTACNLFREHGIKNSGKDTKSDFDNAWDAADKRMRHPDGDQPPRPPKHSHKRPVELD